MPDTIVDKVMQDWVFSGKLQAMTPEQVERGIHEGAKLLKKGLAEQRAQALEAPLWLDEFSSVALPPQQGAEPLTISEVVVDDREWDRGPEKTSPGRKRRGKRENLDTGVVLGPGTPQEKAEILGVSHMTVRRRMEELKKKREEKQ